jgi:hypothetical protein
MQQLFSHLAKFPRKWGPYCDKVVSSIPHQAGAIPCILRK